MKQYLDLLDHILTHGTPKGDRTGTGTISVFGYRCVSTLPTASPPSHYQKAAFKVDNPRAAVVSRRRHQRALLAGKRSEDMERMGRPDGDLGHIYGYQWRSWPDYKGVPSIRLQRLSTPSRTTPTHGA